MQRAAQELRHRIWRSGAAVVTGLLSFVAAGSETGWARSQPALPSSYLSLRSLSQPPTAPQPPQEEPLLRPGSRGPTVLKLQQHLERLGYYTSPVDGLYSAATAAAVRDFQRQHDQVDDGVVGADTWQALSIALNAPAPIVSVQLPAVTPPSFTLLQASSPQPPPSRLWLVVMPLVPLAGGGLTYLVRRMRSKDPFASSESPPPPNPSP
ncbi:MAG: peptidoglycan-binding protein [Cyanobacteria bacterium Co-bin13]|nr:peptidoglycan-binding protein [Cyanobacteria bacterium Co-bin13]